MELFAALAVLSAVGGGVAWYLLNRARNAARERNESDEPPNVS
jgi:hypothetical protein